jgi:hypothetical protein
MEFIIIALLFFFAMFIITFGLAWLITKKERQTFKQEQILTTSLCCISSYNYLFSTPNNLKAFYILFIPFFPIFFIGTFLTLVAGGFLGIFLMLPYVIILTIMAKILYSKRRKGELA